MGSDARQRRPPLDGARALLLLVGVSCPAATSVAAQEYFIMTVAGGLQDGAAATSAALSSPYGVAVDSAGALFIAATNNHRVHKVSAGGTITTVAGTFAAGVWGDGGPATTAALSSPRGVAVDGAGALYIADTYNNRIRKVSTSGTITTAAGVGAGTFSGDGGPATSAVLNNPSGVTVDGAGVIYIADTGNHRIRKVSTGGTITTVAGTGSGSDGGDGGPATSAALFNPYGAFVDTTGTLYIADSGNNRIRKVSPGGTITTVAGAGTAGSSGDGGSATSATLNFPRSVCLDAAGVLTIADTGNQRIRKVSGGTITTVAGSTNGFSGDGGPATSAALSSPYGVCADSAGTLYIADYGNNRIRKVVAGGTISTVVGTGSTTFGGDGGPATSAALYNPRGLAVDGTGALYIADYGNNRIRTVAMVGSITTIAGTGTGGFSGDGGPATSAALWYPSGAAVDAAGVLIIADSHNHRIRKVSAGGTITTVAGTGTAGSSGDGGPATSAMLNIPFSVAVDGAGALSIVESSNHRIRKVSASGTITTVAGSGTNGYCGDGGPATSATISSPQGLAVESSSVLYFTDTNNHRIRKVSAGGTITTVAGVGMYGFGGDGGLAVSAAFYFPRDVAVDSEGALYIADSANNRIRKVSASGIITTIAGTGNAAFSGDGLPATSAALNGPYRVLLDGVGALYIADTYNNRIRAMLPVSLAAPTQYFRPDVGTANQAVNITLYWTRWCAAGTISIGGVACGEVVPVNSSAIVCRNWSVAAAAASLGHSAQLPLAYNISLTALGATINVTGTVPQGLTLVLPPVVSLLGSPTAKGGDTFIIGGFNFQALIPVANNTPSVFIGGVRCAALVVVTFDTLLRCTMPDVPSTTPGYPLLSVAVVNAAGQASNSTLTVEYPSRMTAAFTTSLARAVWPSSAGTLAFTAGSPLTLLAGGKGVLTCTLFVTACATSTTPNPSDAAASPTIVGVTSLSATPPSISVPAVLVFNATGLYAPSGASCNASAQCRDAQGQSATVPTPVTLTTPAFSLAWAGSPSLIVAVPSGDLPPLSLLFSADASGAPPSQPLSTTLLTCVALLVTNNSAAAPPPGTPLINAATYALASTTAVAVTRSTNTTAAVNITCLSAAACDLGAAYAVYAECTWTPTGERVRPPAPLQLRIPAITFALTPPATQLTAYEPSPSWAASATLDTTSDARVAFASAAGTCALQQVNTSSAALQLSAATLQAVLPITANGTVAVVSLVLEGPPAAVLHARLACTVWGKDVVSAPLHLVTAPYLVAVGASAVAPILASDTLAATLFPFSISVRAVAQGAVSIACSLAVNASSIVCPPSSYSPAYGIAYASPPLSTLQLVGEVSASVAVSLGATAAAVVFSGVGIRGGSGCSGNATVTCRDSSGRTASSAAFAGAAPSSSLAAAAGGEPLAPHVALSVAALRSYWDTSTPFTSVPPLPLAPINVTLLATDPASDASLAWPATAHESFSCVASLQLQTSAAPPWSAPLPAASTTALSSCTGSPASDVPGSTTLNWTIACLTTSAAPLGANYNLHAECSWLPTGERLRLPPLPLSIGNASVALFSADTSGQLQVDAYELVNLTGSVSTTMSADLSSAHGACQLRAYGATVPSLLLSADAAAAVYSVAANGSVVGAVALVVEGPPRQALYVQLRCTLWGDKVVDSPPMRVVTQPYAVRAVDAQLHLAWPSGSGATSPASLMPAAPVVVVAAPARGVLSCSLAVVAWVLLPAAATEWGTGLGLADRGAALVGEASVSVALSTDATRAILPFPSIGVYAPSGSIVNVSVACRDGVGRAGTADAATLSLVVGRLVAAWDGVSLPPTIVPSVVLPLLRLRLATEPVIALPTSALQHAATLVSCAAALFPAATSVPMAQALRLAAATAASPAFNVTLADASNTTLVVALAPPATDGVAIGANYTLHAECTWVPSGERLRLPSLAVGIADVRLSWQPLPTDVVLGYVPVNATLQLTIPNAVGSGSTPTVTAACALAVVNTTLRTASVVSEPWNITINAAAAMTIPIAIVVQAPPGVTTFVRAACTAWGQTLASPPLQLTTASLGVTAAEQPPSTFLPSDPTAPWPVSPPLVLRVATAETNATVVDAVCMLTTATPGATLAAADSSASLLGIAADPTTGDIAIPRFIVQTAIGGIAAVTLDAVCKRSLSGDTAPPYQLQLQAVALRVDTCVAPASRSAMSVALPPFSFAVAARLPNSPAFDTPCADGAKPLHTTLPPIPCAVSLNASASTTNDTGNIFLQHTAARLDGATHVASFDAFTVVAPQGETYGLTITCSIGSLPIPLPYAFSVALEGCPPGEQAVSVACVTCGGGQFSLGGLGARCTGCPPAGATCNEGKLTLLPNYYRPPGQRGLAIGPTTELHPCYNAEACALNASVAGYGCAPGYTGPLCGVCDSAANYARFGEACAVCWSPGASWMFMLLVGAIVGAVLTRVALQKETSRSDASIVLRITLGYLQAVGSLRVFRAGSTQAYSNVMGWTEVVSASPLSVGALQCIMWLPYLVQYVATVALPLLAALAVALIFLSVTAARATHCRPRYSLDVAALRDAVRTWLASKRHLSTLLFVLFLAYMPIISASLRALDCVPPIAGLRYLRSDLGVECGVGQHAAARGLAYTVLVVAGLGFPVGLAWLLGTATHTQLLDDGFHATWGFLFDGYRAPTRTLVAVADAGATVTASTGTASGSGTDRSTSTPTAGKNSIPTRGEPPAIAAASDSAAGGRRPSRRRSSLLQAVPERMTQSWVVAGDSRVWWESVVLARKAGVVLLAVTLTNPYLQCVGATLWFAGFGLLQLRYSPYTKALFNRLEMGSLAATFLTAVVSTALLQFNVGVSTADQHAPDAMTALEWTVTVLLVVINLGTFITLAGLWLRLQCRRARGIMRRASVVSVVSGRMAAMRTSLTRRRRSSAKAPLGVPPACMSGAPPTSDEVGDAPAATMNPLRIRASFAALPAAPLSSGARDVPPPPTSTVATGSAADGGEGAGAGADATAKINRSRVADMPPLPVHATAPATASAAAAAAAAASAAGLRGVSFAAMPVARSRRLQLAGRA